MSPKKKKAKQSPKKPNLKRESNSEEVSVKRAKVVKSEEDELKSRKKKNFIEACRQVSCSAYSDQRARLLILYLPACVKKTVCKHNDKNGMDIKEMPGYAQESFTIEIRNNMWYDALEVCQMCITPVQYLSANVLKEVVEIMLNVKDDDLSEHPAPEIIDKCQQILAQNFSTHPPCLVKSLRTCYTSFLTSPMDLKERTYTNRQQYDYKSGIVKYCMNRLENEISLESIDGPLINKEENIPEEMRQSLKGLHWQKEKFEIFELLNRSDRIERLMAVLESVVELVQFDLAIWHSRYTNNLTRHIMRSHKPLMAFLLWSDNVLYTGGVTANSRQIMRLFVYLIHLQYPESMIKTITLWLNIMIHTFYICEQNSNSDYPNTSKYCSKFANEFYKIISEMPYESINRILDRIEPAFMRHLIGILHIQKLMKTNNDCIISILINFFKESQWLPYAPDDTEIVISKKLFPKPKKIKKIINYVIKNCVTPENEEVKNYAKFDKKEIKAVVLSMADNFSLNHLVHTLYTTLEAFLESYDVQSVEETWDKLNEKMSDESETLPENCSYYVTEDLIKKYKNIMKTKKELQTIFNDLKSSGDLPDMLEVFTNIDVLEQ
ncbi:hypothetical protein PYW07_015509 [Mythimna separata]|uniref:Uncharacterized protein n=1 Tax=Mythimna separata TaxID=271217 RepID=A0AAD7YXH2_MYTSE|nr:hypothetical protein PYW07_015509 [Mythimna separata]